jgi:hypothetical protein
MQFAIGRNDTNPELCIRRNQSGGWTSWEGLTAGKAVSITSGDKTISGNLTVNGDLYLKILHGIKVWMEYIDYIMD